MALHTKCFMFKIVNITVIIIIIEKEIILSLVNHLANVKIHYNCYDATKTNEMFVHPCK